MGWFILTQFLSTVLELIFPGRQTGTEKDLEILLLRRQLGILERKLTKPLPVSRAEKWTLAGLLFQLKRQTGQTLNRLRHVMRIFQPETVVKWHRDLVRQKWTYRRQRQGGRPRTSPELEQVVLRLERENSFRTVRVECLNKLLIANETHLRQVMLEYIDYYNTVRPHQGIAQQVPVLKPGAVIDGPIQCRNVLGGIIHDYRRVA